MTVVMSPPFVQLITGPSPTVMVPLGTLVRVNVPLTAKAADVVVAGG